MYNKEAFSLIPYILGSIQYFYHVLSIFIVRVLHSKQCVSNFSSSHKEAFSVTQRGHFLLHLFNVTCFACLPAVHSKSKQGNASFFPQAHKNTNPFRSFTVTNFLVCKSPVTQRILLTQRPLFFLHLHTEVSVLSTPLVSSLKHHD